jgi:hypothetical protein
MTNPTGFSESFILGLIASMGALVGIIFSAFRKSRCSNIECCFGMFKCRREVLTTEELALEPPTPTTENKKLPIV